MAAYLPGRLQTHTIEDWSLLPVDIIISIALNLNAFEDFICFSSVCRSWNRASSLIKHQWRAKPPVPWLLLAENTNKNPNCLRKLFNITNDKCYQLSLPETFGKRCWGSAYGWHFDWFMYRFFNKLIVINVSQGDRREFVIIVIYSYNKYLAFSRHGDQFWTSIIVKNRRNVVDVVTMGDYVFALNNDESIIVEPVEYCPPGDPEIFRGMSHDDRSIYLAQSYFDLLMVLRYRDDALISDESDLDGNDLHNLDNFPYITIVFKVFKLDHKHKSWVEIEDMNDVALFVGDNYSMCVSPTLVKCFKPNCIYFNDEAANYWCWDARAVGQDMGIFDTKYGQRWQFYRGDDISSSIYPPVWFIPQL
ncbi:hypothetical protein RND81_03G112100 [Saponaria officinalis]|uniref:F-box domain-containing protein n=1 Tax=Saponaria officinalis TaxID=3572 RepID=A0AAW1M5N6_SAPOF